MQTIDAKLIPLAVLGLVVVFLFAAVIAADGWVLFRLLTGQPIFPPSPLVARRRVSWGVWTVLLLAGMGLLLPIAALVGYAKASGLLPSRSRSSPPAAKAQAPALAPDAKQSPQVRPAESEAKSVAAQAKPTSTLPAEKSNHAVPAQGPHPAAPPHDDPLKNSLGLSLTEGLAIQAVVNVFLIALATLVLRITSRSPLRNLGLSFDKWWIQATVGVIAFLAIEPVLMATQIGMTRIWESNPHPLLKMIRDEFSPGVPQLAILLAVVVAPLWEEMLFRGVIQSWMVSRYQRRPRERAIVPLENSPAETASEFEPTVAYSTPEHPGSGTDFGAAVELPAKPMLPEIEEDFPNPWNAPRLELPPKPKSPAATTELERPAAAFAGIITTSLIFAALHFDQWPAPIALFLLSVLIGYVYEKTGSLIAAICMHAAFNGLATFFLLMSILSPESAQNSEAKKVKPPAAVARFSAPRNYACIHCEK
jgi:membrane protease YdiL (CAAX protease family)